MSTIPGLPTQGSDVNVLITRVHLHPLCVLVEFWGKFQERTEEYECLAKDIQSPGNPFQNLDGKPGDQCLVRIDGTWYRARVVSRNGPKYSVFLIDKGIPFSPTISGLSWGKKEHFHLPPEVEFCVLANVLPVSPENKWSPVAHEFLKSLSGKSVKAHVQDVLVPNRTFLLHVPCISTQMYEMGFAKKLSPEMFHDFVLTSMQCHSGVAVSPEPQPTAVTSSERLHRQVMFMYPELPGGTVETVIVTEVSNPQRIFCQLKVFSQELKKLSEQLSQSCEGRMSNCIITSDMIGYPCATRGTDGRWYRSVLQQVLQANKLVEVLNVDFGTKQIVQVKDVRPLAAEFFRMPVVTYICSLHGVFDKGVGWTTHEIEYLRSLLLLKTVIGKFEYQSISEGVHYITLYGDDNTNINNLFGSKESSLLECEKTLGDYALRSTGTSRQHLTLHGRKMPTPGQVVEEKAQETLVDEPPAEDLPLHSSVKAVVQHVCNPSEFWIQTQKHGEEFSKMMDSIYHLSKDLQSKNSVTNPTMGLYCAAKAEDGDFYRATVTEVNENQLKVFFVDYGNTEMVDNRNIRTLPAECQTLPRLALKCSLSGVRPKDGMWTQSASEFFINAVTDKVLEVNVMGKCDDSYVVQLTDPELKGQKNLGKLMCIRDFAEHVELQRQSKDEMAMQTAITIPTQHKDPRVSGLGVCGNSEMSIRTQKTVFPTTSERKVALYKECMFPIGSVLDVNVSYIENPNDFWCQLARNAGHIKLLMHDMQAHYEGSKFEPNVETACVARHPDNGMWYRALVINKHGTPHVDVLFVDYGQTETVSLYDVRRIEPEFLTLHGQAFRCSLLNLSDPMSAMTQWNEEAVAKFQDFVDTAAFNFVILKCTIYAVMYSEQRIVFNIVDLETPFESVCTSMVNLIQEAPPKKSPGPLVCLNTYYYSTHGVKTGTEEKVTVTCVDNINQFYCQLEKNTDVLTDLQLKVNSLCKHLQNSKLPAVIGTMCFARYTDKQWYRGQIKATLPAHLVHFVDYGDTIEVARSNLLPVPKEASDIMSVPVQAIMCGLSDIPGNVPSEANSWFETKATECNFRALVVAREPDGKLLVELYCRNDQINAKIKKMFHIKMHTEEKVVLQSRRAFETPKGTPTLPTNMGDHTQPPKNNSSAIKPNKMRDEWKFKDTNVQSSSKSSRQRYDNDQKFKSQVYKPPSQKLTCGNIPNNDSKLATKQTEPRKEHLDTDATRLTRSKSLAKESHEKSPTEKLPRLSDLPLKSITCGMTVEIYVSQCDSPLSFYVHFVKEEDELFSLVENLNNPEATAKNCPITDVHPGDLIQAEFAEDSSLYRAVVKECQEDGMVLVEFVDFGNTARIPVSKLSTLHKSFLHFPIYSTHCMLSDATNFEKETVLDPEVVSAFKKAVGTSEDKVLKCQFISLTGSVWEVRLEDNGVNVTCKVSTQCSEIPEEELEQKVTETGKSSDNKLTQNTKESLLQYSQQEFLQDEKLQVYISIVTDAQTFWCQSANSEELEKITSSVAEVGNPSDHKCISQAALKPGSPCIALFSDDHFWYRAEVINKDGDKLKVLFVDYGNESQVSISDVREMPSLLVEIPPQAFQCELEGFDSACGSWDSSAADKLSALTVDKMLQMTVIKGKTAGQKTKWVVQVECEDQVINETMKAWWKSFTTDDKLCLSSSEVPPEHNSTVSELAIPQTQFDQDVDPSDEYAHLEIVQNDEHGSVELANPCTADNVSKLANGSKNIECPEESVLTEASVVTLKEESVANELMEMVPAMVEPPKGISPPDIVTDETMLLLLDDKDNQEDLTSASNVNVENEKHVERGQPSMEDTVGTEDFSSSVDENLKEEVDESESPTKEAPPKEFLIFSDPEDRETAAASTTRTCLSAAKMVLREIVSSRKRVDQREAADTILEISQKIQTDLALPTVVFPAEHLFDVPIERESEAGNVTQDEEALVEIDSLREEEASAQHVDTHSDDAVVATEPHSDPVPSTVMAEMLEECMCLVEENQSADICTESKESRDDSDVTSEETLIHPTVPQEEVLGLSPQLADAATEPYCDSALSAETAEAVEELLCLVEEGSSTDAITGLKESSDDSEVVSAAAEEMLIDFTFHPVEVLDLQPLHEDPDAAGTEPLCDPVPPAETDEKVDELMDLVEESHSTDVCSGLKESCEDGEESSDHNECLSSDTAEEMVPQEDLQPVLVDPVTVLLPVAVQQHSRTSSEVASAREEHLSSDTAEEMLIYFTEEVLDLQPPLPGPDAAAHEPQYDPVLCAEPDPQLDILAGTEVAGARGKHQSSDAGDEMLISFTVSQKESDFTLPHNVCTTLAEEPTEVQSELPEASSGDTMEATVQDEESTPVEADPMTVASSVWEEKHPALQSDTKPQTCISQFPDLSNLAQDVTCLVGDMCLGDVCREPLKEAGTVAKDTEPQEATTPQQDKDDDDSVLTERVSPVDDSFESQTSNETCLTLVGCDDSADMLPEQQPEE